MRNRLVLGALAAMLGLTGCTSSLETRRFQSRVIRGAEPEEVLKAAQVLLQREFGPVTVSRETRSIDSQPVPYMTKRASGTARDLYAADSAMRQTAHCRVLKKGDATVVMMRIDIEREDTERSEMLDVQNPTGRISDAPAYTPIQRDAATTESQNTVWTFVRRDTQRERQLLSQLQDQFSPAPPQAGQAADQTPAPPPKPDSDRGG